MYLSENEKRKNRSFDSLSFDGLNTRPKISDSEFSDCQNLSSNMHPCITPREERITITDGLSEVTNLTAPRYKPGALTSFTGIADGCFYYEGESIDNIPLSDGPKSIARLGTKIYIFPDKVYLDCNDSNKSLKKMGKSIPFKKLTLITTVSSETGEYKSVIRGDYYFEASFKPGDSIMISGCPEESDNTVILGNGMPYAAEDKIVSIIVDSIVASSMYVKLYNCLGQEIKFPQNGTFEIEDTMTVKTFIPDMKQICVSGGRLWGTSEDGQYIFASAKADAKRYNVITANADDSWNGIVDDDNPFTGIIEANGSVVAFKNNALFQIYGDRPSNFSIKKIDLWGAADERSIAALGNSVYYFGNHGFYRYSGGAPKLISGKLMQKYIGCAGGSDGQKYYACAYREDGGCDVLVYDPRFDVWHREDSEPFVDFISHNGTLYGATSEKFVKMYGGEAAPWYAVSKRYTDDDFDLKQLGYIYIRAELPSDGSGFIRISVRTDDGEFEELEEIHGKGFSVRRILARLPKCDSYQIRLDGGGKVIIHDIKRVMV